ncbi:hypothetical protein [Pelistega europaea]|uniref:Uncharacterized protein n=1 Tax=Pelistega europaea TaxID=106147 RepID=A0A7Y4L8J0_9BURK|nr:hypothetical protein [Pelistega europaea]NOL48863.1 hypothetical protein [Pelistega europaea]
MVCFWSEYLWYHTTVVIRLVVQSVCRNGDWVLNGVYVLVSTLFSIKKQVSTIHRLTYGFISVLATFFPVIAQGDNSMIAFKMPVDSSYSVITREGNGVAAFKMPVDFSYPAITQNDNSVAAFNKMSIDSHASYSMLSQKGREILQQLDIPSAVFLQQNTSFSLANVTWTFQQETGFSTLLDKVKQSSFQRIIVLPGQFALTSSLEGGIYALLWVKQQSPDGYTGTLNLLDSATQSIQLEALSWLPEQAVVLMDIESETPTLMHQWIYLLPFSKASIENLMQTNLRQNLWKRQLNAGQVLWHKEKERLTYRIEDVSGIYTKEGETALYVLKQRLSNE